jgi:hypothetical protein
VRAGESQAAARTSQRSKQWARRRGDGEEDEKEEEDDKEEEEAEGDEDRDAALHGPRSMDPADPAI